MIFPMIAGKIIGGITAIFVAIMMMPKNIEQEDAAAAAEAAAESVAEEK